MPTHYLKVQIMQFYFIEKRLFAIDEHLLSIKNSLGIISTTNDDF